MNTCGAAAESAPKAAEKAPVVITPQMKTVLDYLVEYGEMTDDDFHSQIVLAATANVS